MTPKSTVFAAAIIAAALASPAGVAQATPIATLQSAAGKTDVTPVHYRHGRHYRHYYRHRRNGYEARGPYDNGAYAYQPESNGGAFSSQPNWYYYPTNCPYRAGSELWWCH